MLKTPKNLVPEVFCTTFTWRVCRKDAASRFTTFRQVEKERTGQRTEMRSAVCGWIGLVLGSGRAGEQVVETVTKNVPDLICV